ncbi:MAG TPA: PDZ domain-containing protein [Firmicutes bacterium]|nr:PDZ domain-containing protein [Bacillota bacterium]
MSWVTIPVFILLFGFIVLVHEGGHFLSARWCGATVHEFAIGWGPVLFRTRKKGVLYSWRAIPFGGYVKVAGMDLVLEGKPVKKNPGEKLFSELAYWQKSLILVSGSLGNLLCALLTFIFIAAVLGLPAQVQNDRAVIGFVEPNSPAYEAGLAAGDEIIALNDEPITQWAQLSGIIQRTSAGKLQLSIKRAGRVLVRELIPDFDPTLKVARIGIYPVYVVRKLPWPEAIRYGVSFTGRQLVAIPVSVLQMLTGRDKPQFIGPIGMVGALDQALKSGLYLFFTMAASFHLFLGVFNLLPIPLPLLDGGWIVLYLLERLRRKEFKPEHKAVAQLIGLVVIMAFYLTVVFSDVTSMLRRLLPKG